jgi:hypothetical protein
MTQTPVGHEAPGHHLEVPDEVVDRVQAIDRADTSMVERDRIRWAARGHLTALARHRLRQRVWRDPRLPVRAVHELELARGHWLAEQISLNLAATFVA